MRSRSDSHRPWSPEEVEIAMADVAEAIEDGVAAYRALGEEAATKKWQCDVEESKLLLIAAGDPTLKTDTLRKAWVFQQIANMKLAADIAEHLVKSQAKMLAGLEYQADLLRSAGASHRDMRQQGFGNQRSN